MQAKWANQYLLCCNLSHYTVCQILRESVSVCKNYKEIKKVSVFWNTV